MFCVLKCNTLAHLYSQLLKILRREMELYAHTGQSLPFPILVYCHILVTISKSSDVINKNWMWSVPE